MQRLTARLLLILLLTSLFVPVALAISAPARHTCCMRKPMHGPDSHDSEFQAPSACCNHDCCCPLTVSHFAQVGTAANDSIPPRSASLSANIEPVHPVSALDSSRSGRGPPQFSIA
jgi:hypothetical protein